MTCGDALICKLFAITLIEGCIVPFNGYLQRHGWSGKQLRTLVAKDRASTKTPSLSSLPSIELNAHRFQFFFLYFWVSAISVFHPLDNFSVPMYWLQRGIPVSFSSLNCLSPHLWNGNVFPAVLCSSFSDTPRLRISRSEHIHPFSWRPVLTNSRPSHLLFPRRAIGFQLGREQHAFV